MLFWYYQNKHVPSDFYDKMNFDVFSNFVDLERAEKCTCSRYRSFVSYVSFKALWGHMLFWYGRCQQLTPPESRKIWSFRKKSKNISCVFLLLFFYFFGKISWNFWFFGVTLGKISSRSSQPWRKNKKRKFFGLFLAGRNLWNFGATPYCKSEQTRLYHNSAKSARIGLRF